MKLLLVNDRDGHAFHRILVDVDVGQREMMEWCDDPLRPGFYFLLTAWNIDHLVDATLDEYYVYEVCVTDPDVAFEAKMRWR